MDEALMPREKLLKYGVATLTDAELLAIFLRTGIKDCPVMQQSKAVLCRERHWHYAVYSVASLYGNDPSLFIGGT